MGSAVSSKVFYSLAWLTGNASYLMELCLCRMEVLLREGPSEVGREQGLALYPGLGSSNSLSCCVLLGVTCLDPQFPI